MNKFTSRLISSDIGKNLVKYLIPQFGSILPIDKILETDKSLVVRHPAPTHKKHMLVFPKKRVKDIKSLDKDEIEYLYDMLKSAEKVIENYKSKSQFCQMDVNNNQGLLKLHIYADD